MRKRGAYLKTSIFGFLPLDLAELFFFYGSSRYTWEAVSPELGVLASKAPMISYGRSVLRKSGQNKAARWLSQL